MHTHSSPSATPRGRLTCLLLLAAILVSLLWASASLAAGRTDLRPAGRVLATLTPPRAITDGSCTIDGILRDPHGTRLGDVRVTWGYIDDAGTWRFGNTATTDDWGNFQFSGVRATTRGTLEADISYLAAYVSRENLTFAEGPNAVDIAPGLVSFAVGARSRYPFNEVLVQTYGPLGSCRTLLGSASGAVLALGPTVDYAIAYFTKDGGDWDEGIEWTGTAAVAPGTPVGSVVVDEANASWAFISSPVWASGPPGSKVKVTMENWPAPMRARFYGAIDSPAALTHAWTTGFVGTTAAPRTVTLTIPRAATPGYSVAIHARRSDPIAAHGGISLLDPTTVFEVCTLKAARTTVKRGASVRLSGIVPTQGHWGSTPGTRNLVTVYSRTTAPSGPPRKWDARRSGWTKEAAFRTTRLGAYARTVTPKATGWYIVRYDGDNWYHGGYTAIVKVRVR